MHAGSNASADGPSDAEVDAARLALELARERALRQKAERDFEVRLQGFIIFFCGVIKAVPAASLHHAAGNNGHWHVLFFVGVMPDLVSVRLMPDHVYIPCRIASV